MEFSEFDDLSSTSPLSLSSISPLPRPFSTYRFPASLTQPPTSTARPTSHLRLTSFTSSPQRNSSTPRLSSTNPLSSPNQLGRLQYTLEDTENQESEREKMQGVEASCENGPRQRMCDDLPETALDPWLSNRFCASNEQEQQIANGGRSGGSATTHGQVQGTNNIGGGQSPSSFSCLERPSQPQTFASTFPFQQSTYSSTYRPSQYRHDPHSYLNDREHSAPGPSSFAMIREPPLPLPSYFAQYPIFPSVPSNLQQPVDSSHQQDSNSPVDLPASLDQVGTPSLSTQFAPSSSFSLPVPPRAYYRNSAPPSATNDYSWSTVPEYRSTNEEDWSFSPVPSIASDHHSPITPRGSSDSFNPREHYQPFDSLTEHCPEYDSPFATINHLNLATIAGGALSAVSNLPSTSRYPSAHPSFDENRRFSWPLANYNPPEYSSLSSFNRRSSMIEAPPTTAEILESTIERYSSRYEGEICGSDIDAEGEDDSEAFRGAQTLLGINPSPRSPPQDRAQEQEYNGPSSIQVAQVNLSRGTSKKRTAVRTPSPEFEGFVSEIVQPSESTRNTSLLTEWNDTTRAQAAAPSRHSSLTKKPSLNKNKTVAQALPSQVGDWNSKIEFFAPYAESRSLIDSKGNNIIISSSTSNPSSFSHDTELDSWLGYRRNFLSFSVTVTVPSSDPLSSFHVSTSSSPIAHLEVLLTSSTSPGGNDVELLQFDTTRSLTKATRVTPQSLIASITRNSRAKERSTSSSSTTYTTTFNRIQYRASTANHPAANPDSQDARFIMLVNLSSVHEDGSRTTLGTWRSAKLIVRGRSPGSFEKSKKQKEGAGAGAGQKKRKKLTKERDEDLPVEEEEEGKEGQTDAQLAQALQGDVSSLPARTTRSKAAAARSNTVAI